MYQQCRTEFTTIPSSKRFHCVLENGHYGECEFQVPMSMFPGGSTKPKPRFHVTPSTPKQGTIMEPLCPHLASVVYDLRDTWNAFAVGIREVGCSECATKIAKILNEGQS